MSVSYQVTFDPRFDVERSRDDFEQMILDLGAREVRRGLQGATLKDVREAFDSLQSCMICQAELVPGGPAVIVGNAKTMESIGSVCPACLKSKRPVFISALDDIVSGRETEYFWCRYRDAELEEDDRDDPLELPRREWMELLDQFMDDVE